MENNISTAEEFIEKNYYSLPSELEEVTWLMQEFAKLHVKAALQKVNDNVNPETGKYILFGKEQILNTYPLTNIK